MDKQIDVKSSFGEDEGDESAPPDSIVKVFTYELIVCRKKLNVNHNVIYVPIHVLLTLHFLIGNRTFGELKDGNKMSKRP